MRTQDFARAKAMFAAIAAAMALPAVLERHAALAKIGPYRSRGKGRGTPSKRFGNRSANGPAFQGVRECARRRRQIANYQLEVSA